MEIILTSIGFPLIILIIGLVLEYWVIQPIKHAREYNAVPSQYRRDWSTATTKALRKFKSQMYHYNGIIQRKVFWIEEQEIKRGHSVVKIGISEMRYFWQNWTKNITPNERYEIIIDRTGDILSTKPLLVEKIKFAEKSKNNQTTKTTPSHPNPYVAYLYILVGLLGGSGGLSAAALFEYLSTSNQPFTSDTPYTSFYVVAIIVGIILAVVTDIYFMMNQTFALQRLPLALIVGFIGGWVGIFIWYLLLIAIVVSIIVFFIYKLSS